MSEIERFQSIFDVLKAAGVCGGCAIKYALGAVAFEAGEEAPEDYDLCTRRLAAVKCAVKARYAWKERMREAA